MSKLLINEPPLQVLPSLAALVGLNEAIVIQQIHYWLSGKSAKIIDNQRWIYNGYLDWQEQFPFWSQATIYRIFSKLENDGIVKSDQKGGYDRRKWYTLDYAHLINLTTSITSDCLDGSPQPEVLLTENPETKTDNVADALSRVIKVYESNMGLVTPMIADELREFLSEYPEEWIVEAFKVSVSAGVRKLSYVHAILKSWKRDGYKAQRPGQKTAESRPLPFKV